MDLVIDVYTLSRSFPADERYGLTAQARRAAVSIPVNIAEGKARLGANEYRHFVSIAIGSTAELTTELELAERLGFAMAEDLTLARDKLASVGRMLIKLGKSLTP
jgi:four helix bundle protein